MKRELKKPNTSPAAVTAAIAEELSRRFPPKVIGDKINELLNAKMPAKIGANGKMGQERINERAVESAIKLIALLQQMADNQRKLSGGDPPAVESEEEVLRRLAASPAARKAAAHFLARLEEMRPVEVDCERHGG